MSCQLLCECGKAVVVEGRQAGTTVICSCGRSNEVPSLTTPEQLGSPLTDAPPHTVSESNRNPRRCPCCTGQNLLPGKYGVHRHTFCPSGKINWIGYDMTAFACMDCGFVGPYIKDEDMEDLRKHFEKSFSG